MKLCRHRHAVTLWAILVGFALSAFSTGLYGCRSKDSVAKKRGKGKRRWRRRNKRPKPVHAFKVKQGNIEARLSGTTTLTAEKQVIVVTQISGMVRRVNGKEGRYFRRGAALALLSNPYLKIAYDKARLQVKKLSRDLKRNNRLQRKGYVSKQTSEELQFQLAQAKNELARASQDLRNLTIRATISGIVTLEQIKRGAWVTPQKAAFSLEDTKSLVAVIAVPEKFMPRLKLGLDAVIRAEALGADTIVKGKAIRISPIVDAKTGTIAVTIGKLKPRKQLRSGMFLTAHLILERRNDVPLIPKQAVLYSKNKPYVFRLKGPCKATSSTNAKATTSDCKAEKVFFEKGLENTESIEARTNIKANHRVITLGQQGLQNGGKVRVVKID